MITDYHGQPLAIGDHVQGQYRDEQYTGTVTQIEPYDPGCGNHRHITVTRDDTRAGHQTTSDAVVVLPG
jgi:hypothetical protein